MSTNIPTPIAKPESEITFSDIELKYIKTIAKIRLIGMETAMMIVGFMSRRKKNRIIIAKTAPMSRFWSTLHTIILM